MGGSPIAVYTGRMKLSQMHFSTDHAALLDSLAGDDDLLLIQDLDGVCMELVRDPLTRRLDAGYLDAAMRMDGHFQVLTNGEHGGRRGVNALVDAALGGAATARRRHAYLPGLAAGGVEWQQRDGIISHPGVTPAELAFLTTVPARAAAFLSATLAAPPYALPRAQIAPLVEACVLDNRVSPTLNLNHAYRALPASQRDALQVATATFMTELLEDARTAGLGSAFFVHYAPNLGHDAQGRERLKPLDTDGTGTHDFQFMLSGAVKESGVLVLLNQQVHRRTGRWPLGEDFNVRAAPRNADDLLALARAEFGPRTVPRLVGVGDTVTAEGDDGEEVRRGGSDRGFLQLIQALGECFGTDNAVLYVDSSGGEVPRPALDVSRLPADGVPLAPTRWPATGISDPQDPLRLNGVFSGGHREYVAWFRALAARHH